MPSLQGVVLLIAYWVGLAIAELLAQRQIPVPYGGLGLFGLSLFFALMLPRYWRNSPRAKIWLAAGLIALTATVWWNFRFPVPGQTDISHYLANPQRDQKEMMAVTGWVDSPAQITRSDRIRFQLRATQVQSVPVESEPVESELAEADSEHRDAGSSDADAQAESPQADSQVDNSATPANAIRQSAPQSVTGTLYVTIPRSPDQAAADIHPGQQVQVKGQLYQPASAPYAGAFDFRAYLERRGIFAGLRAYDAKALKYLDRQPPAFGIGQIRYQLAQLRQRIVAAQVKGLGSPKGELVSGIVLGRRAVSMPHDVQDAFIRAGLAHTLSASGFHVSLLLSVVIWMTRRLEAKSRLGIGVVVLISYVGLTGIQPSILRAALMGVGGLVGLVMQRRVKPFAALCGVAFLLLLLNPLWMGSLGFWLSFLATLGLLVTVSPLVKALDWLPPTIAALVAVPTAAVLWTLPLQIYAFGVVSPYSILLNIVATPLIIVITLGGMISALFSLVWLSAGSAIAFLLSYPTQALIFLVNLCNRLPGNSYAVGKILLLQMLLIYGLWGLSWLRPWWQHRRWLAGSLAVLIVAIPASYARATTVELTVLGQNAPTFLLRDRGRTLLLSDGNSATIRYDILPLLQQQGINYVDVAIAPRIAQGDVDGWQMLQEKAPARQIFTVQSFVTVDKATPQQLPLGQPAALDDAVVTVLQTDPVTLKLQLQDQTWLIASYFDWDSQNHLLDAQLVQDVDVLLWYGGNVQAKMLERLQPETAIAFGKMNAEMEMLMRDRNISTYWLQRDGAVRWTPTRQFYPLLESAESAN